jgi:hypothetical protein
MALFGYFASLSQFKSFVRLKLKPNTVAGVLPRFEPPTLASSFVYTLATNISAILKL